MCIFKYLKNTFDASEDHCDEYLWKQYTCNEYAAFTQQKEEVIDNYQTGKLETSEKLLSTEMGLFIKGT